MKSLKLIFALSLIGLLSGCAQIVTKNYSPTRGGVVKYNTGWFMAETNRKKAVEEMDQYCSPGRPQILREDSRLESTGQTMHSGSTSGNSYSGNSTQVQEANIYIQFRCVKGSKTARR